MEKPVRFTVDKDSFFGILHGPSQTEGLQPQAGIVFLNAGIRYRIGPYRQYVRLARRLSQAGFCSLRLDSPGIGDSDGLIHDLREYRRYVVEATDITKKAVDVLMAETGVEHVGLCGLCGGAYNALLLGATDSRVNFLLLLGLPVEQFGDISREAVAGFVLRQYLKKALRWRSWLRLLALRSNYDSMSTALGHLKNFRQRQKSIDDNFQQAFERCNGDGKSVLLIYGGNDPLYYSFVKIYGERFSELTRQKRDVEMFFIQEANHLFSKLSWQEMVAEKMISWLKHRTA